MSYVKNKIYLALSKTQKSALCNFLRALVKKCPDFDVQKIYEKFIEDEEYYFKMENPHFEFLEDLLYDEDFKSDTLLYLKECKSYYDYKETQKPLIEAQKAFEKQRLFQYFSKFSHYFHKIKKSQMQIIPFPFLLQLHFQLNPLD